MNDRFEEILREDLARGGILVGRDGKLGLDPMFVGTPRATQEQLDAHNETQRQRSVLSKVLLGWARNLDATTGRIVAGDSTDAWALHAALFMRLHGLFVDFPKLFGGDLAERSTTARAVSEAIEQLRNVLTEDEQLWAEYRRHADGHLWQTGYERRVWAKGSKPSKDHFESKYTGKKYSFADINERLAGVVRRYGSEAAIAEDFARRLAPATARSFAAMTLFCTAAR